MIKETLSELINNNIRYVVLKDIPLVLNNTYDGDIDIICQGRDRFKIITFFKSRGYTQRWINYFNNHLVFYKNNVKVWDVYLDYALPSTFILNFGEIFYESIIKNNILIASPKHELMILKTSARKNISRGTNYKPYRQKRIKTLNELGEKQ